MDKQALANITAQAQEILDDADVSIDATALAAVVLILQLTKMLEQVAI